MNPRANALGIVIRNTQILVEEQWGKHSQGTGTYYRPIGGTTEFGEYSQDTVVREFLEEIGAEIKVKQYLKCIENIFSIDENIGHEITQVYAVQFVDPDLYEVEQFQVTEQDKITIAKWISISEFINGERFLYPNGLTELLTLINLESGE
ncbi:hypothetical protein TCA2_1532 [Paenibacillus sp. TCA20]|uniref:NUDIX hydrolase n=1 Tax=Paenibacillus TaxID=44249 RepID=UPI0004D56DD0|nr:NUDIX domain-containing protein [Paenibacillus sp. TCA20]GAK39044.1 hypothetical protein TCA2_1532 [Paenibacillus sp. TCA20]